MGMAESQVRPDDANRQAEHGKELLLALPISGKDSASSLIFCVVELCCFSTEACQNSFAAVLPIRAFKDRDEIVPADVADEIPFGISVIDQDLADPLDDLIAFLIAIHVIEWLEVVEIAVGDHKRPPG